MEILFYMFYLLLWCLDMLPEVIPVPIVDMIKRVAFFYVQIILPIFWILMMFVIIAYIVYCIIRAFIPENVLGIPLKKLALQLPPLPPFIDYKIFDTMDIGVGFFTGLKKTDTAKNVATKAGATSSTVSTFGINASGSTFQKMFPDFDQNVWASLFTGNQDPDVNANAENTGSNISGPINISDWNFERLQKNVNAAFNFDISTNISSLNNGFRFIKIKIND